MGIVVYWGLEPRPKAPRCKQNKTINNNRYKNALQTTYEFKISCASTNITLLVWTTGCTWIASIRRSIFASLGCIAGPWHGRWTWSSRLGAGGPLQCWRNNFWRQMQVCSQIFDAIIGQIPKINTHKKKAIKKYCEQKMVGFNSYQ